MLVVSGYPELCDFASCNLRSEQENSRPEGKLVQHLRFQVNGLLVLLPSDH